MGIPCNTRSFRFGWHLTEGRKSEISTTLFLGKNFSKRPQPPQWSVSLLTKDRTRSRPQQNWTYGTGSGSTMVLLRFGSGGSGCPYFALRSFARSRYCNCTMTITSAVTINPFQTNPDKVALHWKPLTTTTTQYMVQNCRITHIQ